MWHEQNRTATWIVYVNPTYPGIHISVSTTNAQDFHATNVWNHLHMGRNGSVEQGNADLRNNISERYKLSLALSNYMTQINTGITSNPGSVDRGRNNLNDFF